MKKTEIAKLTKIKQTKLCKFLYEDHMGEEKAIHCKEIERKYKTNQNVIRYHIRMLRRDNVPICSSRKGYFYASSFSEIGETIDYLEKMKNGLTLTIDSLIGTRPA